MTILPNPVPGIGLGPAGPLADCLLIRIQVAVHQIDYVCRLVEAHEDMAIVRTETGTSDILQMWVPRGMVPEAEELIGRLIADGIAELLDGPQLMGDGWIAAQNWQ